MEQGTVERGIWINAARERVWQAISEPEQLARWLLPPALGAQMARATDGTLSVSMGEAAVPLAIVEAVEAPRQTIFRGLPDRLFAASFTLSEENGGTRVTVTLRGFEALPEDARRDRITPSSTGWERALANLKAYLDGAELPFPEGYVAAMFGYRRESKQLYAVERSIWIAVPRERVWQAITDPKQIEGWFSPGTPWQLSALEVGGRLFVRNQETSEEMYTQVIERIDPPQLLITRSAPEASETTTYTLTEERDGTRLTITHSGYEVQPEQQRWGSMEQNAFGFGMMLDNAKAYIEGTNVPYPGGF